MHERKVVVRIKGGLGNQLFCYSAGRRLALANDCSLVVDDVSGFVRDRMYQRHYMLDNFSIASRKATPSERLEPFERVRRGLLKWRSRRMPFMNRRYVEQEGVEFDDRVLGLSVNGVLYLDGLWQSEGYFNDVEQTIRDDLRVTPPSDDLNKQFAAEMGRVQSVAIHVRWFDLPECVGTSNVSADYYQRALGLMDVKVRSPYYFLFSDDPDAARKIPSLLARPVTHVLHNTGDENAYADLWLMSRCRHFIIANSTFSWWGAWLGGRDDKIVVAPDLNVRGKAAWGFQGLIPEKWLTI